MKKIILAAALLLIPAIANADTWVDGYSRRDGTYVGGHMRSSPNSNRYDNYSSQGNSNPYTGSKGYKRNEYSDPPQYNKRSYQGRSNTWGN